MPAFGGFSLSPDILARIEAANKAAAPSPVAAPVAAQQFVMPDLFDTGFDYADPFADTTADVPMRQVAPEPTGGVVGINPPPATPPAEKNRNTIGISPITTEGAVRVQSAPQPAASLLSGLTGNLVYREEPQSKFGWQGGYQDIAALAAPAASIQDIIIPLSPTTSSSRFGSFNRPLSEAAREQYNTNELQAAQLTTAQFEPFLKDYYGESFSLTLPSELSGSSLDWDQAVSYKTKRTSENPAGIEVASDAQLTALRSVVSPIVERNIAALQEQDPSLSYKDAIQQSYANDPMLQQVYDQLGFSPYRQTDDGSTYWYDPVNDKEIRTFEAKDPTALDSALQVATVATALFGNPMAAATLAGGNAARQGGDLGDIAKAAAGAYIGGQAAAGTGMFSGVGQALGATGNVAKGISAGVGAGVSTAVQGGDAGDILKSGILGGVGGYLKGATAEAASLEEAAKAASASGDFSTSMSLTLEANKLAKQADLVGTITNTAKAADAAISGDYVTALTAGLQATGTNLTEFTSGMLTDTFGADAFANVNIDDVAAAVNKTATQLIDGKDFDKALQEGIKEYVQQGGSLGATGEAVRDFIEQGAGELYENYLKPLGGLFDGLNAQVSGFDTPEGIKAIEDMVKQAGSAIDDSVLQPIKETAEAIYEPIETPAPIKAIEDVAKTAGSAAEDVVREVGSTVDDAILQPIKETAEAIYEPIDAPDIDINGPDLDFNLPDFNIDLSGMFDYLTAALPSQKAPTVKPTDPVYADLSDLMLEPVEQEELLADSDYLERLLRTI